MNARSEVREAYRAWRTAYDVARHYRDEMVPLAKRISEENLLRYNGMLIGVFELLADAPQIATGQCGDQRPTRLLARQCGSRHGDGRQTQISPHSPATGVRRRRIPSRWRTL